MKPEAEILVKWFELAFKEPDIEKLGENLENYGFDDAVDGFWIWDIEGDFEYYSEKWCRQLGYSKDEVGTSPEAWQKMITPEGLRAAFQNMGKHLNSNGEHPFEQKVEYTHKDGSLVKLLCEGSIVRHDKFGYPSVVFGWHKLLI